MTTSHPYHPREREVFLGAVEIGERTEREVFLEKSCADDAHLRARVEALLAADGADDLEPPPDVDNVIAEFGSSGREVNLAGTEVGPYTLIEEIGHGGMGSVWRARQEVPVQREVAIKLIRSGMDTRDLVARFNSERQALAMLDDPNIARFHDAGSTENGRPYFVMELVEGGPVTDYCNREKLGIRERLGLFRKVCRAVSHAHQKGVIHRDLKPSNVIVTADGGLKVIDFGVARIIESESADRTLLTQDFSIIGTPGYMSPEQADGARNIDTRADVYALGALLYELLVGQPPFSRETLRTAALAEIRRMIREDEPLRPSTRVTKIPDHGERAWAGPSGRLRGDLDWIVMQALAKERERRYPTVDALSEDVRRHLENEPVSAAAPSWTYKTGKFVRKHRVGMAWSGIALLALVAGGIFSTVQAVRAGRAEEREKDARVRTQWVLADSFVNLGLQEAAKGRFARARLWFGEATALSAGDPQREAANRMRMRTYGALTPTPLRMVKGPDSAAYLHEIHPSLPVITVHMSDYHSIRILDLGNERILRPPGMPNSGFTAVGFDPSSDRFATAHGEGMLTLRTFPDGEVLREIDLHGEAGRISNLTWSGDGKLLFLGARTGRIYDIENEALWPAVLDHAYAEGDHPLIRRASFSQGKKALVTAGHFPNWTMKLFRLSPDAGTAEEFPLGPDDRHSGLLAPYFAGDDRWVVASRLNRVGIHESDTGKLVASFAPGKSPPNLPEPLQRAIAERPMIAYHLPPNGCVLPGTTTLMTSVPVAYRDLATDLTRPRSEFPGWVRGFLASRGVAPLAISDFEGYFYVWRLPQDERMWSMPCGDDSRPVFSRDGRFLAAAGPNQEELMVHEVHARARAAAPQRPGGRICQLDFSPTDSAVVAIGLHSAEEPATGRIEFWNWRSGERIGPAVELGAKPLALRYHSGGTWLAVSTGDGRLMRIDTATGDARLLLKTREKSPCDTLIFVDEVGPEGSMIAGRSASGQSGGFTHVWDLASSSLRYPPLEHPPVEFPKTYDYRDGILITPGGTHTFCDLATGEALPSPLAEHLGNNRIVFGIDSGMVISSDRGAGTRVLDWRSGNPLGPDLVHEFRDSRWVHRSLPVPGTPWVVLCGMNGVRIFDIHSGRPVAPSIEWPESERLWLTPHCELSPDGVVLACNENRKVIHLIDLTNLVSSGDEMITRALDEVRAGARVVGGGLVELPRIPDWAEQWKALREARPQDFEIE